MFRRLTLSFQQCAVRQFLFFQLFSRSSVKIPEREFARLHGLSPVLPFRRSPGDRFGRWAWYINPISTRIFFGTYKATTVFLQQRDVHSPFLVGMLCFKSNLFLNKKKESNIILLTYAKQALVLQCTPFSSDKLWEVGYDVRQRWWLLLRAAKKAIEAEMLFTSYIQKHCAMAVHLSGSFCRS